MRSINIDEIEKLLYFIVKKLKSENIKEINFESDLYRYIPTNKWDSFDIIENDIESGSLFEDIDSLKKTLGYSPSPFIYVDFDRLASLLRFISEKMNPSE